MTRIEKNDILSYINLNIFLFSEGMKLASEIMRKIAEAERGCDERLAEAKRSAEQTVSDAVKRAESMRAEAEDFGKTKYAEIVRAAEARAEEIKAAQRTENETRLTALREAAAQRTADAAAKTAEYLLQIS